MTSNAETLNITTDAVVKATSDDLPFTVRAIKINFKTDKGACSVVFDRYGRNADYFNVSTINQMISDAIYSVMNQGRTIKEYTVYLVRNH